MNVYNNVCLIPAKLGSTRLKRKNILKIRGKELLFYPIKTAMESGLFGEDIWVSTEANEIKEIAEKYGAKVHIRDKLLAYDPYGVNEVTLEFLNKNPRYKNYDNIFILLPTSPMILAKDVVNAFKVYINNKKEKNIRFLMSVCETEHNAFRSVLVENNELVPLFKDKIVKKTQELPKTYRVNGALIILSIREFLIYKNYYTFPISVYIMPRERSIDIDTKFDYQLAKLLMENEKIWSKLKKK